MKRKFKKIFTTAITLMLVLGICFMVHASANAGADVNTSTGENLLTYCKIAVVVMGIIVVAVLALVIWKYQKKKCW